MVDVHGERHTPILVVPPFTGLNNHETVPEYPSPVNVRAVFSSTSWYPAPPHGDSLTPVNKQCDMSPPPRIYINDDMTQIRAEIAAAARASKNKGKVTDTLVWDGVVFVKTGDTVH
ncbi:hypothetical protein ACOMHN_034060 [Nucella lapillus]